MAGSSMGATAAAAVALLLGYLLADPFLRSPIAGLDFHPEPITLAPVAASAGIADRHNRLQSAEVRYRNEFFGPESIAFDRSGRGPYTGLSDGRVVRRNAEHDGWETVTTTSPSWNATVCSYSPPPALPYPKLSFEHICGRPLGIRFHPITDDLYIADAYHGLFVVPRARNQQQQQHGGAEDVFLSPRVLASEAEGEPFLFTNDLDIDSDDENGTVYFTDTSTKYRRRNFLVAILEGGTHGRLLKHDVASGGTSVLVRGLSFPNGVALSKDRSFLVFCETTLMRCHRYFLRGAKAGSHEVFINLPGFPDNVRLNPRGRFWIAVHSRRGSVIDFLFKSPTLRAVLLRLIPDTRLAYMLAIGWPHGMIVEVDEHGRVTDVLEDRRGKVVRAVSEVEEHDGKLWLGSVLGPQIYVLDRNK